MANNRPTSGENPLLNKCREGTRGKVTRDKRAQLEESFYNILKKCESTDSDLYITLHPDKLYRVSIENINDLNESLKISFIDEGLELTKEK